MANKWTEEQQMVIDHRGSNLLVSAAAGSGKTAVMIERIIGLITDEKNPVDIDRLLVVTFTNAAAGEMKERIKNAIVRRIEENPDDENLKRQLILLDTADITTIDSFCKNIVKKDFHKVDVDSDFSVGDPDEVEILALDVMEELLDDLYDQGDEDLLMLSESYSGKISDDKLIELVLKVSRFVDSAPFPNRWLEESYKIFDVGDSDRIDYIVDELKFMEKYMYTELRYAVYVLGMKSAILSEYYDLEKYVKSVDSRLIDVENLFCSLDRFVNMGPVKKEAYEENVYSIYEDIVKFSNTIIRGEYPPFRISPKADEETKEIYKLAKSEVDEIMKMVSDIVMNINLNISDKMEEDRRTYPYMKALSNLVGKFRDRFREEKKSRGILDFADIEHYALEILSDIDGDKVVASDIAKVYQDKYIEVFTDEYQDSNSVQEYILSLVSREDRPNRFMVGDVKQSIYRFRHARPEIFLEKYYNYKPYDDALGNQSRKINLYKNFRSRKEILDATNFIFSNIMSISTGEIDYTEEEFLNYGGLYPDDSELNLYDGRLEDNIELDLDDDTFEGSIDIDLEYDTLEDSIDDTLEYSIPIDDMELYDGDSILEDEMNDIPIEDNGIDRYRKLSQRSIDVRLVSSIKESDKILDVMDKYMKTHGIDFDGDMDNVFENKRFAFESFNIANIIEELVSEDGQLVYDFKLGKYRRARYSDITILMRSTQGKVDILERVFKDKGIPLDSTSDQNYFESFEIDTVVNILKVIDNPIQDIPILSAMRSPIFGFDSEELAKIRVLDKEISFYEILLGIRELSGDGFDEDLILKVEGFLNTIDEYRNISKTVSIHQLLWKIMYDTGYINYIGLLEKGEDRKRNLMLLFGKARIFETGSYKSLFAFIEYIERLKLKQSEVKSPKTEKDENSVSISTIHRSKGLEYPIVIVANSSKRFNISESSEIINLHMDLGYGPTIIDTKNKVRFDSYRKKRMAIVQKREQIAEEMRLLYVAMTRAKEKLIFSASVDDLEKKIEFWNKMAVSTEGEVYKYNVLNMNNYLDWIISSLFLLGEESLSTGRVAFHDERSSWIIEARTGAGALMNFFGIDEDEFRLFIEENYGVEDSSVEVEKYPEGIEDTSQDKKSNEDLEGAVDTSQDKKSNEDLGGTLKTLQDEEAQDKKAIEIIEENVDVAVSRREDLYNKFNFIERAAAVSKDDILEDIKKEIEFRYEFEDSLDLPSAITVSQIKENIIKNLQMNEMGDEYIDYGSSEFENYKKNGYSDVKSKSRLRTPSFAISREKTSEFSSAEKGSILHLVVQLLDIVRISESMDRLYDEIKSQIGSMVERKIITDDEARVVNISWIMKLANTDIFKKMVEAEKCNKLYREKAFYQSVPASIINPDSSERMVMLGIVDAFIEDEDGGLIIIDYKTDYVDDSNIENVVDRYRIQLDMYKNALENISGRTVKKKYLYLFRIGRFIEV